MNIIPITRWIMICNGCGAPITEQDGSSQEFLPMYETKEDALKASVDAYDEDGKHPAVAEVVIRGL